MSDFDKAIVRAWSAVVNRGMLGVPREVAAHMANGVTVSEVAERMIALRAMRQLPRETLFPAPRAS